MSGSTRSLYRCSSRPPTRRPTDASATLELTRERVVVRRAVRGMKMAINLPVAAYLGVALKMEPPQGDTPGAVSIVLEHRDRSSLTSPFQRRRRHRHRGRMAVVGARAWHAAPGRRSGRTLARSVRPHGRASRRHPHLAASKAHGDQEAAAIHFLAAQARPLDRGRHRASRRTGDYCEELRRSTGTANSLTRLHNRTSGTVGRRPRVLAMVNVVQLWCADRGNMVAHPRVFTARDWATG